MGEPELAATMLKGTGVEAGVGQEQVVVVGKARAEVLARAMVDRMVDVFMVMEGWSGLV